MKKKSLIVDEDEIYLIDLLQIIWENKIKIFVITIISSLIGCGYYYQLPKNYLNSLKINKIDISKTTDLYYISEMISSDKLPQSDQSINNNLTSQKLLVEFIDKLNDYEELFINLKNTKKVKKNIENLSIENQKIKLFKYANLLEIVKNEDEYTINFKWDDPDEARKILQTSLNLTNKNLKEIIFENLKQSSEIVKKLTINNDEDRLIFLNEQSSIARELGISNNQVDNVYMSQSNVSLNINTADIAYYLRGYKAIDKEIELIKNRDYQKFKLIKQKINTIKEKDLKLVNYNIYSMNVKSLQNIKLVLMISILLGLVVGVFYVFIFNAFQSRNTSKKSN
jgi:LPS O-antigen subunit length determinant protein (WzzB/FepE family)